MPGFNLTPGELAAQKAAEVQAYKDWKSGKGKPQGQPWGYDEDPYARDQNGNLIKDPTTGGWAMNPTGSMEQFSNQLMGRQAPQIHTAQLQQDQAVAQQSRQQQLASMQMMAAAAQGQGPTAAPAMLQGGIDDAISQGMSAQPGMGPLVGAQQGLGQASSRAAAQTGQETAQGWQGYMGQANDLRGGDLKNQQMAYALRAAQRGINLSQLGQNMDTTYGYEQLRAQRDKDRMMAAKERLDAYTKQQSANEKNNADLLTGVVNATATAASAGVTSDERRKTNIRRG